MVHLSVAARLEHLLGWETPFGPGFLLLVAKVRLGPLCSHPLSERGIFGILHDVEYHVAMLQTQ